MKEKPLKKGVAENPRKLSTGFLVCMKMHLANCAEVYRQPISERAALCYVVDLGDLSRKELDAAFLEARRTSEFMPVPATIRAAHEKLKSQGNDEYLGPKLLDYPPIDPQEHAKEVAALEADPAYKKAIDKITMGSSPPAPEKKQLTVVPSTRSLEEQKRILREKGFLK